MGAGTCGWAGILAACGTTTVGLTCTGPAGSVQDTLEVRTCGNGVCDTACENATDCPQDCPSPPTPEAFLWVNGSAESVVNVSGEAYTVEWNSKNATSCTLTRNGPAISSALSGTLSWGIANMCDSAADCDPGERCITQPNVYYDETWVLTCSNASGQRSDTVTARVHYRFCYP
ncbi:hypothetical protein HRbin11_02182 [bacterium HR11]|nr:hypothetical protein HRbin11_02182 [bacterium HR11]